MASSASPSKDSGGANNAHQKRSSSSGGFFHSVKRAVASVTTGASTADDDADFVASVRDFSALNASLASLRQHTCDLNRAQRAMLASSCQCADDFSVIIKDIPRPHSHSDLLIQLSQSHIELNDNNQKSFLSELVAILDAEGAEHAKLQSRIEERAKLRADYVYYSKKLDDLLFERKKRTRAEKPAETEKVERNTAKLGDIREKFMLFDQQLQNDLQMRFAARLKTFGPALTAFMRAEKRLATVYYQAINQIQEREFVREQAVPVTVSAEVGSPLSASAAYLQVTNGVVSPGASSTIPITITTVDPSYGVVQSSHTEVASSASSVTLPLSSGSGTVHPPADLSVHVPTPTSAAFGNNPWIEAAASPSTGNPFTPSASKGHTDPFHDLESPMGHAQGQVNPFHTLEASLGPSPPTLTVPTQGRSPSPLPPPPAPRVPTPSPTAAAAAAEMKRQQEHVHDENEGEPSAAVSAALREAEQPVAATTLTATTSSVEASAPELPPTAAMSEHNSPPPPYQPVPFPPQEVDLSDPFGEGESQSITKYE